MKNCGIYEIVNTLDGKRYIGHSKRLEERWAEHRRDLIANCHFNPYLQNAWNKYGQNAFVFRVLEFCPERVLLKREQGYLDTYFDTGMLYNIAREAHCPPRIKKPLSDEARAKRSTARKGKPRPLSEEGRRRLSEKSKLSPKSEAFKAQQGVGKPHSPESIARGLEKRRSRPRTEAEEHAHDSTRGKPSGRKHSPETLAKISATHKGKIVSPESIAKGIATRAANKLKKLLGGDQ